MKKLIFALLLIPFMVEAENIGHTTVEITCAIALQEGNYLNFGYCTVVGAATITVSPTNIRTSTGSVSFSNDIVSANQFTINGSPSSAYTVRLPTSATLTNGKSTITVSGFTSSLSGGSGMLDANGKGNFGIGATLTIPNGASSGVYSGTYSLTCVYQ